MCRGRSIYFSISTRSSPNAAAASRLQLASISWNSAAALTLPHPLPAPAGHRLDQHRKADRLRLRPKPLRRLVLAEITGRDRHPRFLHQLLGGVLETHGADRSRLRPHPDQARRLDGLGEIGILGQEAVAGMDRLGAARLRRSDDRLPD